MISLILSILVGLYILQALAKFGIHFLVPYPTRRKRIDATYAGPVIAVYDDVVLALIVAFVILLVASGRMEVLSFWTGLVVGMTLIQTYFHRFGVPLSSEEAPTPPITPIKLMSYGIQANPRRAWREYALMTLLLVWGLISLAALILGGLT